MNIRTISSIFMVPTLEIPKNNLLENNFINAYAVDEGRETQYHNAIYLLFKPSCLETFRTFLEMEYARSESIVDEYDYADGFVVIVYELNPDYFKDFELIKLGKYSKTSKEFQNLFPEEIKTGEGVIKKSLQFRIFNKSSNLKEYWEEVTGNILDEQQELWETYELSKEILKL